MNIKNWEVLALNKDEAARISSEYNLPAILAMLLQIRGMTTPEKISDMLGQTSVLSDPFELKDMDKAASRIHDALDNFEKIAIYGDYDADGVTSTSILYTYLEANGADVMYYIPNREGEGYGMNTEAVDILKSHGVSLIITVDNGISSIDEVKYAASLGIDVVITDHHRPHEKLPEAVAVVDPYREDCGSHFKDFAGAGVAFKLIMALESDFGDPNELLGEYADLAALGTIGDIVPLVGENRTIVKKGLELLSNSGRPGIRALLRQSNYADKELSSTAVAFTIVPRINATGRMGVPDRAVKLLCCTDEEEALAISEGICEDNNRRREVEAGITQSVIEIIENDDRIKYSRVIVVEGRDWHHGVIGIVAARITEKYGKPCMIISYSDEGIAKGSGRSVDGFSLFDAISACSQVLQKFGGHPMAAGITLDARNIVAFREQINEYAAANFDVMPPLKIVIDCKLMPSSLSPQMPKYLSMLEPYGSANPAPVFGLFKMKLESVVPVGGGNHLRLSLSRDGTSITCMRFSMTPQEFQYVIGDVLDLAVTLETKIFRGTESLTILVKDIKLSSVNTQELVRSYRIYEKFKLDEKLDDQEISQALPIRTDFALLYRFIRENKGWSGGIISLLARLEGMNFNVVKLKICLDVMCERGLINLTKRGDVAQISICDVDIKVDMFASPILSKLQVLAEKQ